MRGLIIRDPYVTWILDGKKTWELRGRATHVREEIALIKGGSLQVVGTAHLVDVVGPLALADLRRNARKLNVPKSELTGLYYDTTYAWVLERPRRCSEPVKYLHPRGAVIWVTLTPGAESKIRAALRRRRA